LVAARSVRGNHSGHRSGIQLLSLPLCPGHRIRQMPAL